MEEYKKEIKDFNRKHLKNLAELKESTKNAQKKYENLLKKFISQREICNKLKIKIQLMVEMKNGYENVISKERKKTELSDNNINHINEENLSEHKKIVKQIKKLEKEIEVANKSLLHNVIYLFNIYYSINYWTRKNVS